MLSWVGSLSDVLTYGSQSATIERWLAKLQRAVSQDDLVSSLQSEHRLEAHRSELLVPVTRRFTLELAEKGANADPD